MRDEGVGSAEGMGFLKTAEMKMAAAPRSKTTSSSESCSLAEMPWCRARWMAMVWAGLIWCILASASICEERLPKLCDDERSPCWQVSIRVCVMFFLMSSCVVLFVSMTSMSFWNSSSALMLFSSSFIIHKS